MLPDEPTEDKEPEFKIVDELPGRGCGRPNNPWFDRIISFAKGTPDRWIEVFCDAPETVRIKGIQTRQVFRTRRISNEFEVSVRRISDTKSCVYIRYTPPKKEDQHDDRQAQADQEDQAEA